jgi:ribonuclease BN (tRNA processing enzyme)
MVKHSPLGPRPRRRIAVFGPNGTADRLAGAYDLPTVPGMAGELDVREWVDREPVRIGPFTVTPFEVNHPVQAYGFRVEQGGSVLAYTGDTDGCAALKPLCRNANLMLADSAFVDGRDDAPDVHLSGRRAGEAARDAGGVGHLVLTHLPPWNDPQVCVSQAREVWDGPLDVAAPGASWDV